MNQWAAQQVHKHERPTPAPPRIQRPPSATTVSVQAAQPVPADGVVVVVQVKSLTTVSTDAREALARRADRALSESVTRFLGPGAVGRLITEVADPEAYEQLTNATGVAPDERPYVCHVFIPQAQFGWKDLIVRRVEAALAEHFLDGVKQAGVNLVLERIHGGTYKAGIAAIESFPRPRQTDLPWTSILFGIVGGILTLLLPQFALLFKAFGTAFTLVRTGKDIRERRKEKSQEESNDATAKRTRSRKSH